MGKKRRGGANQSQPRIPGMPGPDESPQQRIPGMAPQNGQRGGHGQAGQGRARAEPQEDFPSLSSQMGGMRVSQPQPSSGPVWGPSASICGGAQAGQQRPAGPPPPQQRPVQPAGDNYAGARPRPSNPCYNNGGGSWARPEQGNQPERPQRDLEPNRENNGRAIGNDGAGDRADRRPREDHVATRPPGLKSKEGTIGKRCYFYANYHQVSMRNGGNLLQYRVDLSEDIDSTKVKKAIVYSNLRQRFPGLFVLFDGTMLFSLQRLFAQDQGSTIEISTTFKRSRESDVTEPLLITIKFIKELNNYCYSAVQVLNLMTNKMMEGQNFVQCRGEQYNVSQQFKIDLVKQGFHDAPNLLIWPGFSTVISQRENSLMMCCDLKHKVLQQDNVLQAISKRCRRANNMKEEIKKMLIGVIVATTYTNKTYRVDDVDFDKTPRTEFKKKSGEMQTVEQYILQRYPGTQINDINQPILMSLPTEKDRRRGDQEPVMLVPELCRITGLPNEVRDNFRLKLAIDPVIRPTPDKRIEETEKLARDLNQKPECRKQLENMGVQLSDTMTRVRARVLEPQTILFGGKSIRHQITSGGWQTNKPYSLGFSLVNWVVVYPQYPGMVVGQVNCLLDFFKKKCAEFRIEYQDPKKVPVDDRNIKQVINTLRAEARSGKEMILSIIPTNKPENYAAQKKCLYLEEGVPSQMVTTNMLKKMAEKENMRRSVGEKIFIQMAAKKGAVPWAIDNLAIKTGKEMIVGFDTYHDTNKKGSSIGALVSSYDQTYTRYYSTCFRHENNEEVSNRMAIHMQNALETFFQKNRNTLPERIIFYRDGVGEGQLDVVVKYEVEEILKKMKQIYAKHGVNKVPEFAMIIVSKRIMTKIFAPTQDLLKSNLLKENFKQQGREPWRNTRFFNPPPGTIVDNTITIPSRHDFFMVSQVATQGTVNPVGYNIICNTTKLSNDQFQLLTYQLTHLYFNWTGQVKVPAPCQYAHKLAYLVGETLHNTDVSRHLMTTTYYL